MWDDGATGWIGAQFDSKAAQKVPTKMAFHRHLPVTRDAVQC